MINMIQRVHSSIEAREQAGVFSSHVLLNASFFAIMFLASKSLVPEEFAKLSLANSYIGFLSILLAFGLDQAALKLSFERGRSQYVEVNLIAKTALFTLCLLLLAAWSVFIGESTNLIIVAAAAGGAFWSATRVIEQYERNFPRLTWLNVIFSVARIGFGIVALLSGHWAFIVLALYIVAQLPMQVGSVMRAMGRVQYALDWSLLRSMLAVSPLMFASGALYNALPAITLSILYGHGDTLATSAFGVALIFSAPMNILLGTIRIYILPQILSRDLKEIDIFGLGPGSFNSVVAVFGLTCILATLPAAAIVRWFYGDQLPQAGLFFLVYFGGMIIAATIGLYNMRDQRRNLIRVAVLINLSRAVATGLLVFLPMPSALSIVVWSAAILVIGEIALWASLSWAERRHVLS